MIAIRFKYSYQRSVLQPNGLKLLWLLSVKVLMPEQMLWQICELLLALPCEEAPKRPKHGKDGTEEYRTS